MIIGILGSTALGIWTLFVQFGYRLIKGREYAIKMTAALASHFAQANILQIAIAFLAAAGEEIFFRGFIQGKFGLLAGALAFMICHLGKKDIRIIGYWSFFQGLGLGLLYSMSGNLLSVMIAHGFFDCGAMVYFRFFMTSTLQHNFK